MTETFERPEGQVADAVRNNWVDSSAPGWSRPYLRLSRADRPIGMWLLLLPCWWGVLLSAASLGSLGWQGAWVLIACTAGAWLMRGAGCTWNDITDRKFDGRVERTKSRPIPSGQVSVLRAVIWMGLQSLAGLAILLTFNINAILLGIGSLALVAIYPFAKRFTWWPQIFLGLAFNWGALLAWTAHHGTPGWPAVLLYLSGIAWTLSYDTIYAHQDKEDDALIGVKSTARLFAERTKPWLASFQAGSVCLMAVAVILAMPTLTSSILGLCGALAFGLHLAWQTRRLDIDDGDCCLGLFRSNRTAGLIPALFFAVAIFV